MPEATHILAPEPITTASPNPLPALTARAAYVLRTHAPVLAALFALYVIWGSTYLAMHVAIETLPPFRMAGARFLTAGGLMYAFLRIRGAPSPTRTQWFAAARAGWLFLVFGNGFVALAQRSVSTGVAAVIVSTMPLWVAVFTAAQGAIARRSGRAAASPAPSRSEWTGLLLGFAGVALLQLGGGFRVNNAGAVLILLAPMSWALGSVQSRTLPLPPGPMSSAAQMLTAGVAMIALSLALGEPWSVTPSLRSIAALGYLVVFGSIVGFSAFGFLLRTTRPALATSYAYVNPVVALLLGVWFAGETVTPFTWVAVSVVIAGVVVLTRSKARAA